jgi:hypothetical protein
MIKVKGYVDTGFCGGIHEEDFEFEDGTSNEVISEHVIEWGKEQVEIMWEKIEEEEEE